MPKLSEALFGKKDKIEQLPMFTPEQQAFLSKILGGSQEGIGSGMEYLTQLLSGDEGAFEAFEAPMKRQFEEETVPGLAERFAGLDAQGSSAFGQALGQAGAGLTENLAQLREGLKGQALSQLQGLAGMGLGQQFENILRPGTGGAFGELAGGLGQGLGMAATGGLGGLGGIFSKMFGK